MVSYCFVLLSEFEDVLERKIFFTYDAYIHAIQRALRFLNFFSECDFDCQQILIEILRSFVLRLNNSFHQQLKFTDIDDVYLT